MAPMSACLNFFYTAAVSCRTDDDVSTRDFEIAVPALSVYLSRFTVEFRQMYSWPRDKCLLRARTINRVLRNGLQKAGSSTVGDCGIAA